MAKVEAHYVCDLCRRSFDTYAAVRGHLSLFSSRFVHLYPDICDRCAAGIEKYIEERCPKANPIVRVLSSEPVGFPVSSRQAADEEEQGMEQWRDEKEAAAEH
jgi:hypothetical protein